MTENADSRAADRRGPLCPMVHCAPVSPICLSLWLNSGKPSVVIGCVISDLCIVTKIFVTFYGSVN